MKKTLLQVPASAGVIEDYFVHGKGDSSGSGRRLPTGNLSSDVGICDTLHLSETLWALEMTINHEVAADRVPALNLWSVLDLAVGDVLELQVKTVSSLPLVPVSSPLGISSTALKSTSISARESSHLCDGVALHKL